MNRHQVLTGAANNYENTVAIGSVGHNHFTTYGCGGNLIILSSNFDRVQIISSSKQNLDSIIRCIDCTLDTGKIAAAYGNKVFIFEPTPSAKKACHNIHYKWIEVGVIELESKVECVSWNSDGERILIGCSLGTIQMWAYNTDTDNRHSKDGDLKKNDQVKFSISDESDSYISSNKNSYSEKQINDQNSNTFIKIWETRVANSVKCVKFSPDGSLFASYGKNDRLVKIWHESATTTNLIETNHKIEYDFIYLAHPRAVTSISWRQISKFMPRGMISNSLITCCKDNICRIWTETVLPDDGLIQHLTGTQQTQNPTLSNQTGQNLESDHLNGTNINQNIGTTTSTNSYLSNSKSVRHKKKLFHKLQKMRIPSHFPHFTSKTNTYNPEKASSIHNQFSSNSNLSFLTSMGSNQLYSSNTDQVKTDKAPIAIPTHLSTNDFSSLQNKLGTTSSASSYQQTLSRAFHFHLAGLIDPEAASIPLHLLPNLNKHNSKDCKNFVVHWMQNKDFQFTYLSELFSKEICLKLKKIYQNKTNGSNSPPSMSSSNEDFNEFNKSKPNDHGLDSLLNINLDDETKNLLFGNSIDQKLDQMLKDWYSSHDVLFCIHPLDGSVLIWLVDWLDENMPGNIYRQAQVSFHAKLPYSFPVGDSFSLTNSIFLYIEPVKSNMEINEDESEYLYQPGVVNLVSKHNNGTLNLWRMQFQDNSKYQSLVNVTHLYRVCGHRFRVSDITSHPILPFLLTNSINDLNHNQSIDHNLNTKNEDSDFYEKFQKGLVIWGVEPVGPLGKSGGIFELARVDSTKPNAFENITWFPCFLPSSTLGTSSASPSTLFASTDASHITIYQAVFDARTLLHEQNKDSSNTSTKLTTSSSISSSIDSSIGASNTTEIPFNCFDIVSIQSTARPGCIIELEKLVDSSNISNWTKADLFHIYHENLINDKPKTPLLNTNSSQFDETYFLVLLEKRKKDGKIVQVIHMWKIMILSSPQNISEKNRLTIKSTRVCQQELRLPENVYVSCAATAAADLSSSAMFSQNKVPYLFTTACSDGILRFWSCHLKSGDEYEFFEWKLVNDKKSEINLNGYFPLAICCSYNSRLAVAYKQRFKDVKNYYIHIYECESSGGSEWKLEDVICLKNIILPEIDSGIDFDYIFGNSQPIRPARSTHSFKSILFGTSNQPANPSTVSNTSNTNNSSIASHNLPTIQSNSSFFIDNPQSIDSAANSKTPEIPSTAAKISIKRQFSNNSSSNEYTQFRHDTNSNHHPYNRNAHCKFKKSSLIKLDWASNENGSHLLTIGLGNKVFVYSCKTKHLNKTKPDNNQQQVTSTNYKIPITKNTILENDDKPKIISEDNVEINSDSLVEWAEIRSFELDSADDQQALPTQMKWVREGLLIIGLDTEMQVYSQWSPITNKQKAIQEETTKFENDDSKLKNLLSISSKNHSVLDLNKLNLKLTKDNNSTSSSRKQSKQSTEQDSFKLAKTRKIFDESQALELVQDSGLFMHANNVCPILPQYHPKQLIELMNSGKINRAKSILMHLTRCIIDNEFKTKNKRSNNSAEKKLKKRKMSLTNEMEIPEEQTLNFLSIDHIPPLPLFQLYAADSQIIINQDSNNSKEEKTMENNKDLFSQDNLQELSFRNDDFDFLNEEDKQKLIERQQQQEKLELKKNLLIETNYNFDQKVCKLLIEYLEYVQLNGLTSTDQMYLVALADTIVNVNCDLKSGKTSDSQDHLVDDCGFKFLLSLRSYNYLIRTLPIALRAKLKSIGVGTANFAWAFHSECEQDLLNQITNNNGDDSSVCLQWEDLRQYGIGWWLKTPNILKQLVEKIAKYSYQLKNDPLDSALFYLAMRKKGVLWALFKTAKDTRMSEFFKNDFNEPKWQTAALKNAFVLLGKQRFEHAAAFFLLANRLKDAIEVCLRNLNDIQLALVIIRLYCESNYEEQNNLIRDILTNEILNSKTADPFLTSMSYWFIKDYQNALNTLYDIDISHLDSLKTSTGLASLGNTKDSMISHVFNFYTFLKNHPLVLRQQQQQQQLNDNQNNLNFHQSKKVKEVSAVERRLHFIVGYYHLINGCPLLTLDVLTKLPKFLTIKKDLKINDEKKETKSLDVDESHTPNFDWTDSNIISKNKKEEEKVDLFDWSAPVTFTSNRFKDDELELEPDLKMSDDEEENEENLDKEDVQIKKENSVNEEQSKSKDEPEEDDKEEDTVDKIADTFAQQIKFISCLKILIEEMSNLANGFEVIGGQLRYYMYYWLDRETQLLRELGDYQDLNELVHLISFDDELIEDSYLINNNEDLKTNTPTSSYLLHEEVLNDQNLFQKKIKRLNKRKSWLRSNELLLRTLLSYCSLHSASAQGLISVKMELLLLMQELIEDRSTTVKQLHEPVPLQTTTTIPLLSASIASSKNMLAGPIQMLKRLSSDLLTTISSVSVVPTIFDYPIMITTIKEISVSLSSCIYQCLCDSDNVVYKFSEDSKQTKNAYLNAIGMGIQELSRNILYKSTNIIHGDSSRNSFRKRSFINADTIQSLPKNWPGISNLTKLLDRNNEDQEFPKLKILLFESLVAVYASLLINAFVFYDCSNLYRILSKEWKEKMWNKLFGGATQIEYKYKLSQNQISLDDENRKYRMKINARLGHRINSMSSSILNNNQTQNQASSNDEKVYKREKFIPPEISMVNFFLNKDGSDSIKEPTFELDDADSLNGDDSDNESDEIKRDPLDDDIDEKNLLEHMNPKSYSWFLMRYAILKYATYSITSFLPIIGIEQNEIAILSPLIHQIMKTFENWMQLLLVEMSSIHLNGPPENYLNVDSKKFSNESTPTINQPFPINFNGPKILKYQTLLEPDNTPFKNDKSTFGARRLWYFLVSKKCLHEFFIKNIFKRQQNASSNISAYSVISNSQLSSNNDSSLKKSEAFSDLSNMASVPSSNTSTAFKIVHKDQEAINSFCINERDKNMLALSTNREIIEMDMSNLLMNKSAGTMIDDDYEMEMLAYNSQIQGTRQTNYEQDIYVIGDSMNQIFNQNMNNSNDQFLGTNNQMKINSTNNVSRSIRSNSLANVVLKRNLKEVRKLASHPTLPYYLSGTSDSVVKLWHWGSTDPLSTIKQQEKTSSAKITQILFNSHGNKFGISDVDGYLHLYQLLGCSFKPYLTLRCHKNINDFLFVESSSILLTAGTVSDSYVVSLWDTLMPSNKTLIKSFKEQDVPSGTCAAYSPLSHLAYCGTRKGEVYVYDIRMHKKLSKFTAHESSVKAMALNSDEYLMATGSSEGTVKIWNLKTFELKHVFPNEHSKSSLIRSFNSGVNQIRFTNDDQLLSCGSDGTMVRNTESVESTKKQKIAPANSYLDFTNGKATFDSFISTDEINLETFMNEYWDKKPLLIKRSENKDWLDYIKKLFSLDILKSILDDDSKKIKYETDINLCKLVNGEKTVLNKKGIAKLSHVMDSFDNNKATIQFHQPQRFRNELWNLMEKFECFFGNLVGSNIYITPNDSQGLPPHHDDINAFVIQLEGKKHWLLYDPVLELPDDYCLVKDKKYLEKPILDIILEPGDILFFHRGIIHQANTPDLTNENESSSHSTHITISTYQNFNRMEYLLSTIEFAIRNSFKENLSLRQGLPIGFLKQDYFSQYLKKSLENLKIKENDCYPIELLRDFMSSRLPPFGISSKEEASLDHLTNIQKLDENLQIRLKYPEHVYYAIKSEKFDNDIEEAEEDEEDDEGEDDNKDDENDYKLLIFYSTKNLRKKHMMAKNTESLNLDQNCLKTEIECECLIKLLINNNENKWFTISNLKAMLQDSCIDKDKAEQMLRSFLISLKVENIIETQI
ncbi:unnamed protein product [Brachionus calyciflorus]|uniref:JmjC domain-containing protein n=1 Tax=Brachionus calyciflorus TaxID=104777 RepID=A0A813M340_9BILA|nr:unnamed protein product [Brachionus calyciflorus]